MKIEHIFEVESASKYEDAIKSYGIECQFTQFKNISSDVLTTPRVPNFMAILPLGSVKLGAKFKVTFDEII